ncbi:MAG TPA: hypothetical protein VKA78_06375 [Pyrinomonadaceae bacterium]|nr:hypothetical protein [Pyrinomonadaceae bacterium]
MKTVEAEDRKGRKVTAIKLRRLPFVAGTPTVLTGTDRLDVIAQRKYSDGTKFWHVADANTELEANDLAKPRPNDKETREINVPEN